MLNCSKDKILSSRPPGWFDVLRFVYGSNVKAAGKNSSWVKNNVNFIKRSLTKRKLREYPVQTCHFTEEETEVVLIICLLVH